MKKIILGTLLMLILAPLMIQEANAQTVATIANSVLANVKSIPKFITTISYVMGIVCGIQAALKFKEFNESKGQIKISVPIYYTIGAALLIGVPLALKTGIETFGYGATGYSGKSGQSY